MSEWLSKTKRQLLATLGTAKMRRKHGLFTVEGIKGVTDCMKHFNCEYLVVTDIWEERNRREGLFSEAMSFPVYSVSEKEMAQLSQLTTPSGVLGVFSLPESHATHGGDSEVCGNLPPNLYLMLDGVQDPGNLGTIIRTAHWFGISTIFASRDTADVFNPKTIQATMGSLGAVKVVYADLGKVISSNPGIPVAGLQLQGKDIFATPLPEAAFLLMGNEGNGISAALQPAITLALTIPPYAEGHAESLNVAVATAITLAEFRHPHQLPVR